MKSNKQMQIAFMAISLLLSIIILVGCQPIVIQPTEDPGEEANVIAEPEVISAEPEVAGTMITISDEVPADLPDAPENVDLTQASIFAWQEFIALNWPATSSLDHQGNGRDTANTEMMFGQPADTLVWHTFRNKIEIYPPKGAGQPHGYVDDANQQYGYDDPPKYVYAAPISACSGTESTVTPWINLDENDEIGLDSMFAGVVTDGDPLSKDNVDADRILFLAKANRNEYIYSAANQWFQDGKDFGTLFSQAAIEAVTYTLQNNKTPPAPSLADPTAPNANGKVALSLPSGTIEIKTGWRRLTDSEKSSGRFYSTMVRYYKLTDPNNENSALCYVDEEWGMAALHIIHKTPMAPYFVYATFSQADNILNKNGDRVEDEDGNLLLNMDADPMEPNIMSKNATAADPLGQVLTPNPANSDPGHRLYYSNTEADPSEPQGIISVNKRQHDIPQDVINVNTMAHASIQAYNASNGLDDSPWLYYKLVNVQWIPATNPNPGERVTEPINGILPSTYYLANEVVETDYNLQVFSGQLGAPPANGTITDFIYAGPIPGFPAQAPVTKPAQPFHNVFYNGQRYNMGGCMGCHGNAQINLGRDFSFILGSNTKAPQAANSELPDLEKFEQLFGSAQ